MWHEGIHHYTIGQRRGLGVSASRPLYVVALDPARAEVRVGEREELLAKTLELEQATWSGDIPSSDEVLLVQQRYRSKPDRARLVSVEGDRVHLAFLDLEARGAPGQAAVIYRDDCVVGGGRIARESSGALAQRPLVQIGLPVRDRTTP